MLDGLKRLFSRGTGSARSWADLVEWAESKGHVFRPVREEEGFVIEGRLGALPWRLEWGPSQRPYVVGHELRLRAELGLPAEVQALVLDRALQAAMERAVFDQYVEGVQTRIDNQTPPEMRWLVMFPKLAGSELAALRDRYAAVGPSKSWLQSWLEGPLTAALATAPLVDAQPLVLMISRGRLTLRTALSDPLAQDLEVWLRVFHTALREARRVGESMAGHAGASTQPSLWSASPDETPDAADPHRPPPPR